VQVLALGVWLSCGERHGVSGWLPGPRSAWRAPVGNASRPVFPVLRFALQNATPVLSAALTNHLFRVKIVEAWSKFVHQAGAVPSGGNEMLLALLAENPTCLVPRRLASWVVSVC
jgi:hypothetical protein